MIGKKFGKLTIIEEYKQRDKHGKIVYKCLCDCGNYHDAVGVDLRKGNIKSCGCLRGNMHGKTRTRLYNTWSHMKQRCYNEKDPHYPDYGARGIVVCDEWKDDFTNFYSWAMDNNYQENLTIDRIDVNGNYEPDNCRWATKKQQNENKRNSIHLTYNGKTKTISQWCKELGLKHSIIYVRYHLGYTDKECLFGRDK